MPEPHNPAHRLSVTYSHPKWLVKRWLDRLGEQATETVLRANNEPAPLTIRTNTLRISRDALISALQSQGARATQTSLSPPGIEIISSPGIASLPSYQEGLFLVQDEAAQLIAYLLGPEPGETVLDACAAPGGKATHLAELMQNQGLIVALEADPKRLGRLKENAQRLGARILRPVLGDATRYREGGFDRVLIDAPCSGLGLLRRHPDSRWHKSPQSLIAKQALQRRILKHCAGLLRPGGILVYATCTTEPEENDGVIRAFLADSAGTFSIDDPRPLLPPSAALLVDNAGFFRTFPSAPSLDGFFGVRLRRAVS